MAGNDPRQIGEQVAQGLPGVGWLMLLRQLGERMPGMAQSAMEYLAPGMMQGPPRDNVPRDQQGRPLPLGPQGQIINPNQMPPQGGTY